MRETSPSGSSGCRLLIWTCNGWNELKTQVQCGQAKTERDDALTRWSKETCLRRLPAWENVASHNSHLNFDDPPDTWHFVCCCKEHFWENFLPHWSHWNRFSSAKVLPSANNFLTEMNYCHTENYKLYCA